MFWADLVPLPRVHVEELCAGEDLVLVPQPPRDQHPPAVLQLHVEARVVPPRAQQRRQGGPRGRTRAVLQHRVQAGGRLVAVDQSEVSIVAS